MKLILASDLTFLLKSGFDLTGIPKDRMKVGYITTASKVAPEQSFFEAVKKSIRNNGYAFEEIDIDGKSPEEIRAFFRDKNVILIEGGNTFYLLKVIRETGFDRILKELIDEGKVFIGTSAGAYIMCPTVDVAGWNNLAAERFGVNDNTGLGYVPFALKVHYHDSDKNEVERRMKLLSCPLRILRDGQGIVVDGENTTFIGENEVVFSNTGTEDNLVQFSSR